MKKIKLPKNFLKALAIAFILINTVILSFACINSSKIYAITLDGNPICYVEKESVADAAINDVAKTFSVDNSSVKVVDSDNRLKVEKVGRSELKDAKMLNKDEAAECIVEQTKADNKPLEISVASSVTEVVPYTPEPNYEKDDTMLAGQAVIKVKGKDGKQKQTKTYTTKNGKVVDTKITASEILDEGSKATVIKGTIGLPEGKDWKTYSGDPEFKDGEVMVAYGKLFLGNPYKYGGTSLTNGIDCVQFVRALYRKYGINLPNNHPGIRRAGVGVSLKNARAGDIVCYAPHHMGIYIGNGQVIHATRRGIRITSVHYSTKKIVTIRRVVK